MYTIIWALFIMYKKKKLLYLSVSIFPEGRHLEPFIVRPCESQIQCSSFGTSCVLLFLISYRDSMKWKAASWIIKLHHFPLRMKIPHLITSLYPRGWMCTKETCHNGIKEQCNGADAILWSLFFLESLEGSRVSQWVRQAGKQDRRVSKSAQWVPSQVPQQIKRGSDRIPRVRKRWSVIYFIDTRFHRRSLSQFSVSFVQLHKKKKKKNLGWCLCFLFHFGIPQTKKKGGKPLYFLSI